MIVVLLLKYYFGYYCYNSVFLRTTHQIVLKSLKVLIAIFRVTQGNQTEMNQPGFLFT